MKKERNIWVVVGITLPVLLLLLIAFGVGNKGSSDELDAGAQQIVDKATKESLQVKEDEKKSFTNISIDEYLDYYNGSDPTIVLLARPTCHYCEIAEPILQKIAYQNDLDIKYLNTDDFDDEAQTKFVQSNDRYKEGYGTPNLLIVANSSIIDIVDGLTDTDEYLGFFRDNGFIN